MATEATNGTAAAPPSVTFTGLKQLLVVEASKANDAVAFYKAAFGAEEVNRVTHPKRKSDQDLPLLLSAEIKLGSSTFLISDLSDDSAAPHRVKAASTGLVFCLETENIEDAVEKAVKAGAEGEGACGGGRVGKVKDPYGVVWLICTPAKKHGDVAAYRRIQRISPALFCVVNGGMTSGSY